MYEIADQVARWIADGQAVHVAQVVETVGFSSRDASDALAWTDDGSSVGLLLPGVDADLTALGAQADGRLVETVVSDRDAVAAGLSCGGTARVFVQNAGALPGDLWDRLTRREPVCLVHEIVADAPGRSSVFTPETIRAATQIAGDAPRLFGRGASATAVSVDGDTTVAITTLWPPTTLLVVGNGTIADALADVATLLGWATEVTNDAVLVGDLAAALTESDAVVVLSHDRDIDVPALAAVLAGRAGYVGGLGSRPTQAARREGLLGRDVSEEQVDRIHGPAGLDIDAHTPGEIAVSIIAEIIASRSNSSGAPISRRDGPVHTGGVHAPPPRY